MRLCLLFLIYVMLLNQGLRRREIQLFNVLGMNILHLILYYLVVPFLYLRDVLETVF